jgi:hypothetical protein
MEEEKTVVMIQHVGHSAVGFFEIPVAAGRHRNRLRHRLLIIFDT